MFESDPRVSWSYCREGQVKDKEKGRLRRSFFREAREEPYSKMCTQYFYCPDYRFGVSGNLVMFLVLRKSCAGL